MLNRFFASLLLLCSLVMAAEDYSTWGAYSNLMLNTTATGADVGADVIRFPILVKLLEEDFKSFGLVAAGGADIRFSKKDGAHLPYEIDHYVDGASDVDTAYIWVQMDTVFGNTLDTIRMYYDNASATDSSNGPAVFDSTTKYKGVWHIGPDSAVSSEIGGNATHYLGVDTAGIIGGCQWFDGTEAADNYVSLPSVAEIWPDFTYSCWFNADNAPSGTESILGGYNNPQIRFLSTGLIQWFTSGGGVNAEIISMNAWHHVVATVENSQVAAVCSVYIDGELSGNNTLGAIGEVPITSFLNRRDSNEEYPGFIDEARISSSTRSSDWVRLSYQNQQEEQTLIEFAPLNQRVWTNFSGTGLWDTTGNWLDGILPTASDTVWFNVTSTDDMTSDVAFVVTDIRKTADYTGNLTFGTYTDTIKGDVILEGDLNDTMFLGASVTVLARDWKSDIAVDGGTSDLRFISSAAQATFKGGGLYYDILVDGSADFVDSTGITCNDFVQSEGDVTHLDTVTIHGDWLFNCDAGAADVVLPVSMTLAGNSGEFHIGADGTVTTTTCSLSMNTANAGIIDHDGAFYQSRCLVVGESDTVTITGTSIYSVLTSTATPALILKDNASLTINDITNVKRFERTATDGPLWEFGSGYRLNGNSRIQFRGNNNGTFTVTLPAINYTGSNLIYIVNEATCSPTFRLAGDFTSSNGLRTSGTTASTFQFHTDGYDINITTLDIGCSHASGTALYHFADGTKINLSGGLNSVAYNSGTTTVYDTASWTVNTNFNWKSGHEHLTELGNSFSFEGNTQTVTSAGAFRPDSLHMDASVITMADHWSARTLNMVSGVFAITNGSGIDTVREKSFFSGSSLAIFDTDTMHWGGDISGTGNHIRYDATTLWYMGDGAGIIGFDGDTLPHTVYLGDGGF